jgi:hypothetical protein
MAQVHYDKAILDNFGTEHPYLARMYYQHATIPGIGYGDGSFASMAAWALGNPDQLNGWINPSQI